MDIYDTLSDNNVIGTIQDVSLDLYDELLTTGSSVLLSDVIKIMIINAKKYAGWSGELRPIPLDDESEKNAIRLVINENTVLDVGDWIVIEPTVRAHCDLVQARRMEGAQNLGVQPSGMASSEARQIYDDALERMKKEAFQCQPFSIEIPRDNDYAYGGIQTTRVNQTEQKLTISKNPNNIITVLEDGVFAEVPTPKDSAKFIETFNTAFNKDD